VSGPILVFSLFEFARSCGFSCSEVILYWLACLVSKTAADATKGNKRADEYFIVNKMRAK